MDLRVSVLGYGAIGRRIVEAIAAGRVHGVELVGVITRTPGAAAAQGHRELDLESAIRESDLIVECAGVEALSQHGPAIIAGGCDLLIASLGALADERLRHRLLKSGPGRCRLTAGAIGGLDLLGAAARDNGLDTLNLTSTKRASSLIQPWMDEAAAEQLRNTTRPITLFDGSVLEAIRLFPKSFNVGIALAMATGLWEQTTVRLVADPDAPVTTHEITAEGSSGSYRFSIANHPLAANPASSAVVSAAILRGLSAIARPSGTFA